MSRLRDAIRESVEEALEKHGAPAEPMSTKECADHLGIAPSTLEVGRTVRPEDFPPYAKVGRRVVYLRSEVYAWLRARQAGGGR